MGDTWTAGEAVMLCRIIEATCPKFGCHVALTGGLLYKNGPRKDADLLFYRIRQVDKIDVVGLFAALAEIGIKCEDVDDRRWCIKATWLGKPLDCFFPEADTGAYDQEAVDG